MRPWRADVPPWLGRAVQIFFAVVMGLMVFVTARAILRGTDGDDDAHAAEVARLTGQLARERLVGDSLRAIARAAAAPHDSAITRTDAGARALVQQLASARAAARRDSLTLAEARAELEALAWHAEAMLRLHQAERAAAATRIQRLEIVVRTDSIAFTTADQLIGAQSAQVRALARKQRWWRQVLRVSCHATGGAGGAALGAVAGGPGGAAIGAVLGVAGGTIGCR